MDASDASSSPSESTGESTSTDPSVAGASIEARERLEQHYREIERTYDDTRARIENLNERAVGFIRDNPGVCIMGALAAGFVVGRLASRRWLV